MNSCTRPTRRGFTLIELLIVISIIALLALIVVPKLSGMLRRSKEAALRENLYRLRTAISQFYSDTGEYPGILLDLVAANQAGLTIEVNTDSYRGPYLAAPGGIGGTALPINPFVRASEATVARHWDYDATTGAVTVTTDQFGDNWQTFIEGSPFKNL